MAVDESSEHDDSIEIPEGKRLCLVTQQLREDTEHERNRQQFAEELFEEYGYDPDEQMDVEHTISVSTRRFPIDLVVFEEDQPRTKRNIRVAVEIEPNETDSDDPEHGLSQIKDYMSMSTAEFGVWYNGIEKICLYQPEPGEDIVDINDIPPRGLTLEDIEVPEFGQLVPAFELRSEFKRCHNYIAGNQGLHKTESFLELLKVIFCKVHDERRNSTRVKFYVTNTERRERPERCADRISELFEEVKNENPEIFDESEQLNLSPEVIAFVTNVFQRYSLIQTDTDAKGEAYEEIVGDNLRGDRGEFFTPRNICRAAVEMAFHTIPEDDWGNVRVIDPACGTGGFLIAVIEFLTRQFYQTELDKWGDEETAEDNARERVREFCEQNLFGIDMNPTLVRAAKMNAVMHGGAHGNIFKADSLESPEQWPDDSDNNVQENIEFGTYDLLFANPPFGADIPVDSERMLRQFDIGHRWDTENLRRRGETRTSAPPEQLFIERAMQLLKPGGKMVMVIPDNILTNPGLSYIRHWLMQHARVIASISIPREAFEPFVGTKSHLVFLEKKDTDEIGMTGSYDSFISIAETIGHNKRGETIHLKTAEGNIATQQVEKKVPRITNGEKHIETKTITEEIVDDELPAVVHEFKRWWDSQ